MADKNTNIQIPAEKFQFVQLGSRISDKKFDDKPIGYFKDAWIRFRKNKASVVASIIIIFIVLFSLLMPLCVTNYDSTFMNVSYAKKAPRLLICKQLNLGFFDGGQSRTFSETALFKAVSVGVGAEYWDCEGNRADGVTIAEGLESYYQPIISLGEEYTKLDAAKQAKRTWDGRIDGYLELGFMMVTIEQSELADILAWEEETGKHILYPLIADNEYARDESETDYANYWFKVSKNTPISVDEDGNVKKLKYSENLVLEENYRRDKNGDLVYYTYTGGGDLNTAQYKIRVLYYNWFTYKNGFEPEFLLGTDTMGYDLALRTADGIRLSLLISVSVTIITFIIGAIYGAIAGYYGGTADIIMERITDILSGIPFIIVATLFQIHLGQKVGPITCLLFAYISTGWIGNAGLVRTQFYRFKTQEYVMAARTLGASDWRLITKHIFPNSLGTIVTSCALDIPSIILSESSLAFLGIMKLAGSDSTSLGVLLSDASGYWTSYPHLMLVPALVISLLMISFNLFGNGLRDAFNPSLRGVED